MSKELCQKCLGTCDSIYYDIDTGEVMALICPSCAGTGFFKRVELKLGNPLDLQAALGLAVAAIEAKFGPAKIKRGSK